MKPRILHFFAVCSAVLTACAVAPNELPLPMPPAPTCSSAAQCEFKWAAARTFVLTHAGFKFQTYSADFMETYNPGEGDTGIAARVNKEPLPDGTFKITASFWCNNVFGCARPLRQTLVEFNQAVSSAEPAK